MRIRHAATTLVALGAVAAGGVTAAVLTPDDGAGRPEADSSLLSSEWAVETAPDFGTAWSTSVQSGHDSFTVRVDTTELRDRARYQPLTLRTTRGSTAPGTVTLETATVLDGDPAAASGIRVRSVVSRDGTCAATAFAGGASLLVGDGTVPLPVTAASAGVRVPLGAATATTAGPPVTLCTELSADPVDPGAEGTVTVGWPLRVERAD